VSNSESDLVMGGKFILPPELMLLIDRGVLPVGQDMLYQQLIHPLADPVRLCKLVPDALRLCLFSPPFETIGRLIDKGDFFWLLPQVKTKEISPSLAVLIGDFGEGTDSALILDYRHGHAQPQVMRLGWDENATQGSWVYVASTFSEFANLVGLEIPANNAD